MDKLAEAFAGLKWRTVSECVAMDFGVAAPVLMRIMVSEDGRVFAVEIPRRDGAVLEWESVDPLSAMMIPQPRRPECAPVTEPPPWRGEQWRRDRRRR